MSHETNINHNSSCGKYDAIIFDIDGVLIDVVNSYNQTIEKTIQYVLSNNFNTSPIKLPVDKLIDKFRFTGGFNNDIDTAYSIILITLYCKSINKNDINEIFIFTTDLLEKINDKGILSVEKELEKFGNIKDIKTKLGYPKDDNIISSVFNEIFYGPDLFKRQFKKNPSHYLDKPFINNDKIIIKEKTIQDLSKVFNGKLILMSGRSKVAAEFTLNELFDYFIKDACIFLEDEKREFAKPNTYGIHRIFNKLNLKNAIYVGDSIEDLLMIEKFRYETDNTKIFFCGICGTNTSSPEGLRRLFELKGADIIVENVNNLPHILNNTKK